LQTYKTEQMKDRILEIILDCDLMDSECAEIITQMFCDEMAKKFHEIGFFIFDLEGLLLPFGFTKEQIELSLSKLK